MEQQVKIRSISELAQELRFDHTKMDAKIEKMLGKKKEEKVEVVIEKPKKPKKEKVEETVEEAE